MTVRKKSATKKIKKKSKSKYHVRLSKDTDNFWNFHPTIQSVYWILISIGVIGTAVINYNTSTQINDLLIEINAQQLTTSDLDIKAAKLLAK